MRIEVVLTLATFTLLVWSAFAEGLHPFVLPWDDATKGPTNIAEWLPKPAGKEGHVRVGRDGHLYTGHHRNRFFGVNLCFGANFPKKSDATAIAARMAKFGVNCVRFHHMDSHPFPDGIRARNVPHSRALDPEALDRLDYLIAELKKNGIYVDLNLLVSRPFLEADGLPKEIESLDWKEAHVVGFFYEPILALQKEYARQLLTHRNPYTGTTYAEEPAVAFVEINNENGLIHAWMGRTLDEMPDIFKEDLRRQWNAWLKKSYGSTDALRRVWNAEETLLGDEMLINPTFHRTMSGWTLETHDGAEAFASPLDGGGVRVTVTQASETGTGWHVQLNQGGLRVRAGVPYTLTFRARAGQPLRMSVGVSQAHKPWRGLGFNEEVRLTETWRDFRFVFTLTEGEENARLNFSNLGVSTGTVDLAEVSLRPGGFVGLAEGEHLEDASVSLLPRTRFQERTTAVQNDWVRFLWETEEHYWQTLYRYLKEDLGVAAPIVGTIVACSTPNLQAEMDALDTHAYWQHPQFPGRPWDPENWTVGNTSMVNRLGGVLTGLALQRVVGKPILCTEYNHAAPNTYSSEAPLLLAAFAALQDWDGVFLFSYSHRRDAWDLRRIPNFFDVDQHPTKMANLPLAAAMFLRGDVRAAREQVVAALTPHREREAIRQSGRAWAVVHGGHVGLSPERALIHRIGISVGEDAQSVQVDDAPVVGNRAVSDTGEVIWDVSREGKGVVTINTSRTKVIVGFVDGRSFPLDGVTITPGATRQDWCTLGITLLEGDSFVAPGRALIVATGDTENTAMGWKSPDKSSVGRNWGEPPSLIETIPFTIRLPLAAHRVEVWALDTQGQRARRLPVEPEGEATTLHVDGSFPTLWYEVVLR